MTIKDFILRLYELDKDVKIVSNCGDFSEVEIRLFMLDKAKTVEQTFKSYFYLCELYDWLGTMKIYDKEVRDIIFHDAHLKKDRFYEVVFE